MIATALLVSMIAGATAQDGVPISYALIVTNNRSLEAQRPDLQYADDDGAAYAELFEQVFGAQRVTLLTRFDAGSAKLHASWATRAVPPTREALDSAVASLGRQLTEDAAQGHPTRLTLVFAGHGDLDGGEGFVELEDARLTAAQFEARIIALLPAGRIHVMFDSCNSYFMLNPRKPGGRRWANQAPSADGLLSRHPNVGVIVSTSAEAVTYEWSELQSGIFSYEVRSGLRGGADANGDGQITYAELAAFISIANSQVPNDYYRPKLFAQGPANDGSEVLVDLRSAVGRRLELSDRAAHRITIRDPMGVRLLDLHTENGFAARVLLPSAEALDVSEVAAATDAGGRPTVRHYLMGAGVQTQTLEQLTATEAALAGRGDVPVFRALFDKPFGPHALEAALPTLFITDPSKLPQGVTQQDADRLRIHLRYGAQGARSQRFVVGGVMVGLGGVVAGGFLLASRGQSGATGVDNSTAVFGEAVGTGLSILGIAGMFIHDKMESLATDFDQLDSSTEAARSAAVVQMEGQFEEAASRQKRLRKILGGFALGVGAALIGGSSYLLATTKPGVSSDLTYAGLVDGVVLLAVGMFYFFVEQPLERAWQFYLHDSRLDTAPTTPPAVILVPHVGTTSRGSPVFGMSGNF